MHHVRSTLNVCFLVAGLASGLTNAWGQESPNAASSANDLVVHIEGLSNDTIYLAHYYGTKLFYNDTAVADVNLSLIHI